MPRSSVRRFALSMLLLAMALPLYAQSGPLRFRVTLSRECAPHGASGRLIVLMSSAAQKPERISIGFVPGAVWVAAREVSYVGPGETIELDPDVTAYPKPFSQAPAGTYHFMALLDPDHTYAYSNQDAGDLYSAVQTVADLKPASAVPVALTLDKVTPARAAPADRPGITLVEFESPLLSRFWGRPVLMRAGVVLPPDYETQPGRAYPAVYSVHGFGGNHLSAWYAGPTLRRQISEGKRASMVHVYLDASCPTGHHVFADSVNNGPWGTALTTEFIPYLEKRLRLVSRPYARFLTGHSSGGWSTLWLQVAYPDFFGGTWSTSPDPVDLRSFTGIDASPGSTDNAYRTRDGKPKNLVRAGGRDLVSMEQFVRQEEVQGEYGGQIASFEWVWSPKGQDGRPMKLFNRVTGEQDPFVQRAWQRYDIRYVLETNWATLGPKLRGKLNILCGDADTFHLNEAAALLFDFLKRVGSDAVTEMVPGRDHGNLYQAYKTYPDGLAERIDREMWASFQKHGGESARNPRRK